MGFWQAVFLGVVQGITEFLPVSSSGHLIFLPKLFGWQDQGLAFDVIVHLGTLLAVVVFFREKLWNIAKSFLTFGKKESDILNRRLGFLIILSIIPAGVAGLLFEGWIETNLRSASVVGVGLVFWGIILGLSDLFNKKLEEQDKTELEQMNWKEMLIVACAQAIALIPGTSRSGITMTAGLFSKLKKDTAAEFSFLMSVPIIFLAGMMKVIELIQVGLQDMSMMSLVVGFLASAVSGFFAIWGLMKVIKQRGFLPFVVYRVIIGVLILFFIV